MPRARSPTRDSRSRWSGVADEETLAVVTARATGARAPLDLEFALSLLPDAPGQRELSGKLRAPDWPRIADGELQEGRLTLDVPDLRSIEGELTQRTSGCASRRAPGRSADSPGRFLRPDREAPTSSSTPTGPSRPTNACGSPVRGRPSSHYPFLEPGGQASLDVGSLDLSRLGVEGLLGIAGGLLRLDHSEEGPRASLRLEGRELIYGDFPPVERLRLEAETEGRVVSARLSVVNPLEGIDQIEMTLRLQDGILHVEPAEIRHRRARRLDQRDVAARSPRDRTSPSSTSSAWNLPRVRSPYPSRTSISEPLPDCSTRRVSPGPGGF